MDGNFSIVKQYDHMGWIPCVLGSLDFSLVNTNQLIPKPEGEGTDEVCFSYINDHSIPSTKHRTRYNVVSSVYDWKDREDNKNEYDGEFRFLTFGATQPDGSMEGEAFLILHEDSKKVTKFGSTVLSPLKDLASLIDSYQGALKVNQYSPTVTLELKEVVNKINAIKASIREIANNELRQRVFNTKFIILPNGLTYLRTEDWLGVNYSPENRSELEHSKFIADKQCFIYLKYSLHRHKHHNGQEDRLTSVHKIDTKDPRNTGLKLIGDLNRSIAEIKEREIEKLSSPDHYLQGFISYAKSLVFALEQYKFISPIEAATKSAYLDNMRGSWEAVIAKTQEEKTESREKRESNSKGVVEFFQALSILIATFSLIFNASFKLVQKEKTIQLLDGTLYEGIVDYLNSPIAMFNILIVLFFMTVIMVAGWIVWQPHGLVRRSVAWLKKRYKSSIINGIRLIMVTLIVALIVFCLGLTVSILNS